MSDNRADVPKLQTRCLVLQCSNDIIAPLAVGDYLAKTLLNATLRLVDNIGHCTHLSAPQAVTDAMHEILRA